MFCPACGQQQISPDTRFCSRCGLPLGPVAAYLADPSKTPTLSARENTTKGSARSRGLKQGLFFFLLAFLVVPIVAILSMQLGIGPELVAIMAVLFGAGGILRMVYALLFESAAAGQPTLEEKLLGLRKPTEVSGTQQPMLPTGTPTPASDYASPRAGKWRETNELQRTPPSVTDETTKLLHQEENQ